jgi:hypothetical protein
MSGKKIGPRQKMINMMYLVLTALLAMNVSKEVLNASKIVDKGIENSNETLQNRNNEYYNAFEEIQAKDKTEKVIKLYALNSETKILTQEALLFISEIQQEIKDKSGVELIDGKENFKQADDLNTGTRILTKSKMGTSKGELL